MPDFTNMDPTLVASFWIYFVASFAFGILLGVIITNLFFKREKSLMSEERKKHQQDASTLKSTTEELTSVRSELEKLKKDISQNTLYWKFQKPDKDNTGNASLYEFFHQDKDDTSE